MVNFALATNDDRARAVHRLRFLPTCENHAGTANSADKTLNKNNKQMISRHGTIIGDWMVGYLAGQIETRAMTRDEAIAQIRASLERVKLESPRSVADAEKTAAAMIASLPREPG
jgi:hypothetical protein